MTKRNYIAHKYHFYDKMFERGCFIYDKIQENDIDIKFLSWCEAMKEYFFDKIVKYDFGI